MIIGLVLLAAFWLDAREVRRAEVGELPRALVRSGVLRRWR